MFLQAYTATMARCGSEKARSALSSFRAKLLEGDSHLNFRERMASRRYKRQENRLMRDPETALTATPITRENVALIETEIAEIRRLGYAVARSEHATNVGLRISYITSLACLFGSEAMFGLMLTNPDHFKSIPHAGFIGLATVLTAISAANIIGLRAASRIRRSIWTDETKKMFGIQGLQPS